MLFMMADIRCQLDPLLLVYLLLYLRLGCMHVRTGEGRGDNFLGIKLGLSGFSHKCFSSTEPS